MSTSLCKTALVAAALTLPLAGAATAGPVAPPPIVPFANTGDLFVQIDGLEGIARVDPTTGAASLFISDDQIEAALAAAGQITSDRFAQTNLAFDQAGNLYFTSNGNDSVLKRTAAGELSVLTTDAQLTAAASSSNFTPGGIAFGNDGYLYVVDQTSGSDRGSLLRVDPMTGAATEFRSRADFLAVAGVNSLNWDGGIVGLPNGLPNGKIYIANEGGDPRGIIEVDLGTGTVAVTAGQAPGGDFGQPTFVTRGPNGNLFVTINGSGLQGILEVDPDFVGDVALNFTQFLTQAQITAVTGLAFAGERAGIAFDDQGNLYFADTESDSILKFLVNDPTGTPTIGAGTILTSDAILDALDDDFADLRGGIAFAPGDVIISDETFVQVAEPGTLAILGVGLAGLAAARRRKRA